MLQHLALLPSPCWFVRMLQPEQAQAPWLALCSGIYGHLALRSSGPSITLFIVVLSRPLTSYLPKIVFQLCYFPKSKDREIILRVKVPADASNVKFYCPQSGDSQVEMDHIPGWLLPAIKPLNSKHSEDRDVSQ